MWHSSELTAHLNTVDFLLFWALMGRSNSLVQGERLTYAAQQNQQKEISRQTFSVYKALTIMQKALGFNNMSDLGPK